MKKVEINGIAKVDGYINENGNYADISVNGIDLGELITKELLNIMSIKLKQEPHPPIGGK